MALAKARRCSLVLLAAGCLAGCGTGTGPFGFAASAGSSAPAGTIGSTRLVERDVEVPEVFQTTDDGLWDGRPSLGGVWVAHASAKDPERVIIRNEANGKFVIGALFRRERDFPGPKFQLSSDAAAALGIMSGAPVRLEVTALRREETPGTAPIDAAEVATAPLLSPGPTSVAEATTLSTSDAIAAAPRKPAPVSKLEMPYLQIGIFSLADNADRAAGQMTAAGLSAQVRKSEIGGKPYWRVLVGPAETADVRAKGLTKVKALGYSDAYAVKG